MAWVKRDCGLVRVYEYKHTATGWIGQFCKLSKEASELPNGEWFELDGPIAFDGGVVTVPVKKPRTVKDVKEEIVQAVAKYSDYLKCRHWQTTNDDLSAAIRLVDELRTLQSAGK